MHIPRCTSDPPSQKLWGWSHPGDWFRLTLEFEDHWCRETPKVFLLKNLFRVCYKYDYFTQLAEFPRWKRPRYYTRKLYTGKIELLTMPVIRMFLVEEVALSESVKPGSQSHRPTAPRRPRPDVCVSAFSGWQNPASPQADQGWSYETWSPAHLLMELEPIREGHWKDPSASSILYNDFHVLGARPGAAGQEGVAGKRRLGPRSQAFIWEQKRSPAQSLCSWGWMPIQRTGGCAVAWGNQGQLCRGHIVGPGVGGIIHVTQTWIGRIWVRVPPAQFSSERRLKWLSEPGGNGPWIVSHRRGRLLYRFSSRAALRWRWRFKISS